MKPAREIDGRNVFCVDGVPPEQLAYAMSAYSRSNKSFKDRVKYINANNSSKFLEKFYLNYGHASIADQAHVTMPIEDVSILAAMIIVGEQLWDGQERSTRYQDFRNTGYVVPDEIYENEELRNIYNEAALSLFGAYESVFNKTYESLTATYPKPKAMSEAAYKKTLEARSFDVARYLLPLCTKTSFGQITSARTLESQISRLMASEYGEVRRIAEAMKQASMEPAWNPFIDALKELIERVPVTEANKKYIRQLNELIKPTAAAPTLVKYTSPSVYPRETRTKVRDFLTGLGYSIYEDYLVGPDSHVELLEAGDPIDEAIAKLFYVSSHLRYKTCLAIATELRPNSRKDLLDIVFGGRGKFDQLLNEFRGSSLNFDVLMDIGAYRDLHRHRRLHQFPQQLTDYHGFDIPTKYIPEEVMDEFTQSVNKATRARNKILSEGIVEANYILPLAMHCRCLFSMDIAEVAYIAELRTKPSGHFSYRNVAYKMYTRTVSKYPELKDYIRVTKPEEENILQR